MSVRGFLQTEVCADGLDEDQRAVLRGWADAVISSALLVGTPQGIVGPLLV